MALSTQPVKGARDFYPDEMRVQKYIFAKWREVCERFGYEEYDTPILEPTDIYLNKGNQEIIEEQTYTFSDRGGRSLTLRTEMTPSVTRLVAAKRQEMGYPLRLYSIPQCWRYERMQRGRGREFYQLNVDLFGVESLDADFEIVQASDAVMQAFGAKRESYIIKLNSRKLMDALFGSLELDPTQKQSLSRLIDKRAKMDEAEFIGLIEGVFSPSQRESGKSQQLIKVLNAKTLAELPPELGELEPAKKLSDLLDRLSKSGVSNVVYDPSLMRGFEYYTDIAFEVFDTNPENNRSMFGGGRYDDLMSLFGSEALPSVGFGMGDITLLNFLESNNLLPEDRTETDIYLIPVGKQPSEVAAVISELREMGVNVAVDLSDRSVDKQIKTAEKKGITYVMFVGQAELDEQQYSLKNIKTGDEEKRSIQRIVSTVKDYRKA